MPAMAIVRDIAVVLRRFEYSETSQVLVLFTRAHGKVRTLAKGMKRSTRQRFAAAVDVLDVGAVALLEQRSAADGLSTLTEWKQQRFCGGLRERLDRIHAGQYAAEVTAMLTEDWDAHPALFDALAELLSRLNDSMGVLDLVVGYQCTLLSEVGLWPRFDACVLCGRRSELTTFSALEGGAVCRHCEPSQIEKRSVPGAVIASLAAWSAAAGPPFDRPPDVRAFDVLDYHLSHAAGRPPSTGRLLRAHFEHR
ncbi:MAG: DNA repair protein RecO [Phycisphaerales bacterium]|nr:MAG: DNA repair protein RecO [Phycisphaerales bacterium]